MLSEGTGMRSRSSSNGTARNCSLGTSRQARSISASVQCDGPVFLPLLDVAKNQIDRFVPPKPAREQDSQECTISFTLQCLRVRCIPEPLRLFWRQPIAKSDSDFLHALDPSYASGEVWAQQPAIGRLVGEAARRFEG